nr:MAG TPA: hypothetical protein [Crassvirales sp.]
MAITQNYFPVCCSTTNILKMGEYIKYISDFDYHILDTIGSLPSHS